jgi:hypothetical protein
MQLRLANFNVRSPLERTIPADQAREKASAGLVNIMNRMKMKAIEARI